MICRARSAERGVRSGFTLLEVVLAVSIGLTLLYGLYLAMDLQVAQTQAGRELVEQGTVARGVFARLAADIESTIRPVDPREAVESSSDSGSTSSTSSTGSDTSSAGGSGSSTGSTSSQTSTTTTTTSSTTTTSTTTTTEPFNIGVNGGSDWLILTTGRVPRELVIYRGAEKAEMVSDLRRSMYWIASGNKGLAWYQGKLPTSAELASGPETVPDEEVRILAPEVMKVMFEYFDGVEWAESWDSRTPGEDGTTPLGPPAAIRITLTLRRGQADSDGQYQSAEFTHVVAIPTANNLMATTTSP